MAAVTAATDIRIGTADVVSELVEYGATIAFGQPVYLDISSGQYKLADANNTSVEAQVEAIAITPGASGGFGLIARTGTVTYTGTTFVVGRTYFVGQTPGSIIPPADLTTGDRVQRIGTAITADTLKLSIEVVGVQHA